MPAEKKVMPLPEPLRYERRPPMEAILFEIIKAFGCIAALSFLSGVMYYFLDKVFLSGKPEIGFMEEEFKKTFEDSLL